MRLATKRASAGTVIVCAAAMLLGGCGGPKLTPVSYEEFSEELYSGGYYSRSDELVSDSEDGTSTIIQTDSGWLVGFYECADNKVAEAEFTTECTLAGMDAYMEGGNYTTAELSTEEEYRLYVRVDNTCLFIKGLPEHTAEINAFAEGLGYSDQTADE